jgi:hypothetical protein
MTEISLTGSAVNRSSNIVYANLETHIPSFKSYLRVSIRGIVEDVDLDNRNSWTFSERTYHIHRSIFLYTTDTSFILLIHVKVDSTPTDTFTSSTDVV